MNESKTTGDGQNCEEDVTGVTELNGDADCDLNDAVFNDLTMTLRKAIDALRASAMSAGVGQSANQSMGDGRGLECPQCGEQVWVEQAEAGRRILVNSDGSPHRDACPQPEGVRQSLWPFDSSES